jgi:serine/threonine protein kinase
MLITRMMEPDPVLRPDIDEILLHPNIQAVCNKSDRRALNSTPSKATTPSKASLESSKATLIISPSTVALEMQQQRLNEKITSSQKKRAKVNVQPFFLEDDQGFSRRDLFSKRFEEDST